MKFKKTLLLLGFISSSQFVFAQGVPTIDGAHIANSIQEWTKEAERFKESMDLSQKQLESMTGIRDISGFMNEAQGILNQVDDLSSWLNKQSDILKYGKDILSPELKKIFDSYGLTNICNGLIEGDLKNCEGQIIVDVVKQQNNENNLKTLNERISKIDEIANRMKNSDNPKETLDLSNAMNTQIALLNADKIKLDIQKGIEDSNKALIEKQKQDAIRASHNNHNPW